MVTISRQQAMYAAVLMAVGVEAIGASVDVAAPGRSGNCDAIQMAINALPATGGEISLQAGTYMCYQPIVIDKDNVRLRGQGAATLLRLATGADSPVVVIGQTVPVPTITRRNISIENLTIDGNRTGQHEECWGGLCNTNPIRNNGITIRRAEDVYIGRVTVYSTRSGGLVSELTSRRLTVRDFTSYDNQYDGLAGYQTEESSFSGIKVHDNLGAGLSFDIGFNHNHLSEITITDNDSVGVFMRDSHDNLFGSLQVLRNGDHGVFLAQVDADTSKPAAHNLFTGLVVSGSAGAGLRVNDASCVGNMVIGGQLSANAGGCISEATPGMVQDLGVLCR